MRRKCWAVVLGSLLCGFCYSQDDYTIVYDLYFELIQNPETGDQLIYNNNDLFDGQFYECLNHLKNQFFTFSRDHYRYCDAAHSDSSRRSQCYSENEPAKVLNTLNEIDSATRGQTRWSQGMVAQAAVMAKQYVGANRYVQLVRSVTPAHRPFLLCSI